MEIKIYTQPGCSHCTHIQTLLKRCNLNWEELVLGQDIPIEQFRSMYPLVNGVPFVVIDGENFYDITVIAKKFLKEGRINAPQFPQPETEIQSE
jgi:glutaredoxin